MVCKKCGASISNTASLSSSFDSSNFKLNGSTFLASFSALS